MERCVNELLQRIVISEYSVGTVKWVGILLQGLCILVAVAIVYSDNRLTCAITLSLFATGIALSVLGGHIGSDVKSVCTHQKQDNGVEHNRWVCSLDVGGKSFPGDPPDARTHGLNRGHQGICQWHRPKHVEAELSASLGVGGYAAWVVVSHPGDKPRPDPRQGMLLQAAPNNLEGVHAPRSLDAILRELHAFRLRLLETSTGLFRARRGVQQYRGFY